MTRYYFGKEAAIALLGQRVRSLVEFRGVPKGTTGRVVRANPAGNGDTYSVGDLIRVWSFLLSNAAGHWVTTREVAQGAEVGYRTARGHALKLVRLGIVDMAVQAAHHATPSVPECRAP
jgi:hypothetical protein